MNFLRSKDLDSLPKKATKSQTEANGWDVVSLSFKLFFERMHFWIQLNFWSVVFSLGIITLPGAKAALYQTVAAGLRDPGGIEVVPFRDMRGGFKKLFGKSFFLTLLIWVVYLLSILSIYFWIIQDGWVLRFISIFPIYFVILWWISSGYFFPILIENPEKSVAWIVKKGLLLGFKKPFISLLFAVTSLILLVFGIVLMGPIMLFIPSLIALLMSHGYWYVTDQEIPGFQDIVEYSNKHYSLKLPR